MWIQRYRQTSNGCLVTRPANTETSALCYTRVSGNRLDVRLIFALGLVLLRRLVTPRGKRLALYLLKAQLCLQATSLICYLFSCWAGLSSGFIKVGVRNALIRSFHSEMFPLSITLHKTRSSHILTSHSVWIWSDLHTQHIWIFSKNRSHFQHFIIMLLCQSITYKWSRSRLNTNTGPDGLVGLEEFHWFWHQCSGCCIELCTVLWSRYKGSVFFFESYGSRVPTEWGYSLCVV